MAKLNTCFKRTFVFFNVLFAIFGVGLMVLGRFVQVALQHQQIDGKVFALFCFYFLGSVTLIVSVLGAYGAHKEKKCPLIFFFIMTCISTVVLFLAAVPAARDRDQEISAVREALNQITPLNRANKDIQDVVEYLQKEMKCCGVFKGYEDWGEDVPASCNCVTDRNEPDQCQRVTVRKTIWGYSGESRLLYSQPCGTLMMDYFKMFMTGILGVLFGFAFLALLASVMSLGMIIRITFSSPPPRRRAPLIPLNHQPPTHSELYKVNNSFLV